MKLRHILPLLLLSLTACGQSSNQKINIQMNTDQLTDAKVKAA